MKMNASILLAAITAAALSACGGGEDQPSTKSITANAPSASISQATTAQVEALLHESEGSTEQLRTFAGSRAGELSGSAQLLAADPPPPVHCASMYFGASSLRCLQPNGYTTLVVPPQGTGPASISPPTPFCNEVPVGKLLYGVTPAPGSMACYQFPVNANTTVNYSAVLPAGISGIAELFYVLPNTAGLPVARSANPSALAGSVTAQYQRLVLIIRTSNGTGGKVFGFGINATVPEPLAPNATLGAARDMDINEEITDTLPGPLESAVYFFPHKIGQTESLVSAKFNPANVKVEVLSAQRTSGGLSVSAPLAVTATQAVGTPFGIASLFPANTATSTDVTGTLLKVTGLNPAVASPPFTIRVGMRVLSIEGGYDVNNTENITRWFPGYPGLVQAANNLVTKLGVKDETGAWVKNQPVKITILRHTANANTLQTTTYTTSIEGKMSVSQVLPTSGAGNPVTTAFTGACNGTTIAKYNYGAPGSTDRWNGTAQEARFMAELVGATTYAPKYMNFQLDFLRICTETYIPKK